MYLYIISSSITQTNKQATLKDARQDDYGASFPAC